MSRHTISFDETAQGWTSFYSFMPDWMLRLGNRFFTIKEGNLFLHNDDSVPRNNFYGEQFGTKLKYAVNQQASDIKVFKALGLEGNQPWEALIRAFQSGSENYSESTIKSTEFVKKEGYWYAHTRRNELVSDFSSKATYGIGMITDVEGTALKITYPNDTIAQGDVIYTEEGTELGTVLSTSGDIITLDVLQPQIAGTFIYGVKDARVEGAEMRGYTAVVELENSSTDKLELFATNSEVFKSHR